MFTVALPLLALQAPPVAASVNVTGEPAQTDEGPAILPAAGVTFTAITFVAVADPQLPVTV
jgi:hypothetical protein